MKYFVAMWVVLWVVAVALAVSLILMPPKSETPIQDSDERCSHNRGK